MLIREKNRFLAKISILGKNVDPWKKLDFWLKFRSLAKMFIRGKHLIFG